MKSQATIFAILVFFSILLAIVFGLSSLAVPEARNAKTALDAAKSYALGEAGIEDVAYRAIMGKTFSSLESVMLNGSTVNVTVTNLADNSKQLDAAANISGAVRKVRTILMPNTTGASFFYGVQAGEGGVSMDNNSKIQGTGGAVGNFYSNGPVQGSNGATITGDVTVATGLALSDQSAICNADQIVGQTSPEIDFAQGFKASVTGSLSKVSLYLKKVGTPGNRTVRITTDSGGFPSQSDIASGTLDASLVSNVYGWVDIVLSSPPTLAQNTTYWIVLDAAQNSTKYWVWCKDGAGGYANGSPKYSHDWDEDPWSAVSGDLSFQTYTGTGESSLDNVIVYGSVRANSITNSKICGDAYYKLASTIDASSKNFLDNPTGPTCPASLTPGTGFPNQSDPTISPMPISQGNIAQWKVDAASGGTITGNCGDSDQSGGANAACVVADNGTLSLGPSRITGNLVLTKKQTLTVTGTLYIQGHIDIDSNSEVSIRCDALYLVASCVVVSDSWMHAKNNLTFQGSGGTGSHIMFLTALSGCNGGNQQSQCTHHNGAIDIHNNATGAIFYASDSMIHLHNGVTISEITAYKIELGQNAIVNYEQGLQSSQFSSGPGGSYRIKSWQEVKE